MSQKFENENFPGISGRELVEIFYVLFHVKQYTLFFINDSLISNTRLKLAKKQANAKQHPETEFLLFENYSHYSFTL